MGKLNDKFDVYSAHLGNVIADTTKHCGCATLRGIYNKLTKTNTFLRSAFLSDLLLPFIAIVLQHKKRTLISLLTHEKYIKLEKIYFHTPKRFLSKCQH